MSTETWCNVQPFCVFWGAPKGLKHTHSTCSRSLWSTHKEIWSNLERHKVVSPALFHTQKLDLMLMRTKCFNGASTGELNHSAKCITLPPSESSEASFLLISMLSLNSLQAYSTYNVQYCMYVCMDLCHLLRLSTLLFFLFLSFHLLMKKSMRIILKCTHPKLFLSASLILQRALEYGWLAPSFFLKFHQSREIFLFFQCLLIIESWQKAFSS